MSAPAREVICDDALAWMRGRRLPADHAVITALPDVRELGITLEAWRAFFLEAARLCLELVDDQSAVFFFQTDTRKHGYTVAKGGLIVRAVEDAGARVLLHKVVTGRPPNTHAFGRAAFTHLIGASRGRLVPADRMKIPDVLVDESPRVWTRAMSTRACALTVELLRDELGARVIVDPFAGKGTVLAVANALGLDALGVERHRKRAEEARALTLAL